MEYRLPDQKYTEAEAEYLFQTIEMAKSDEEYEELCSTPPPTAESFVDLELVQQEPSIFSWKVVKRRPHRRYTVSHGAPPAPPSTPTSLTANSTPSPTASSAVTATAAADDERLSSLLYILDYAPKYKKKLKEQQRTDAELAELFDVVTITGGGDSKSSKSNLPAERGISAASRAIRKNDASTKIFKIHRNPKEFFREPDEEDSVSAPEYDTEEEDVRYRRLARHKATRRLLQTKRLRRFARFEHSERMDAMVDNFDAAMNFTDNA